MVCSACARCCCVARDCRVRFAKIPSARAVGATATFRFTLAVALVAHFVGARSWLLLACAPYRTRLPQPRCAAYATARIVVSPACPLTPPLARHSQPLVLCRFDCPQMNTADAERMEGQLQAPRSRRTIFSFLFDAFTRRRTESMPCFC
eukprot:3122255-Pleurochrysis_carterae.AAC.1